MHERPTQTDFYTDSDPESTLESNQALVSDTQTPEKLRSTRIQTLNDLLRTTFLGGKIMLTQGIHHMPEADMEAVIKKVQQFNTFTKDNDPYGEHDFGIIKHGGDTIYWKIDYYNKDLSAGSEDPTDPAITTRVLTIMQRSEY